MDFASVAGAEPIKTEEIAFAGFARNGKALHVYWHPCGHEMERPDERVKLTLGTRRDASLAQPVLVDPLTSTVYQLGGSEQRGDQWTLADAPLADHPLIVTDRAVVLG